MELPVARAYYHLQRGNYPQVIPFLETAIERANNNANKARYSYIIAQLHYREGRVEEARKYYQKALEFSNDYEMTFNTQLAIIRSSVQNNTMTSADAMAQLEKMVKDIKNVNYLGRIYYLMGTLAVEISRWPSRISKRVWKQLAPMPSRKLKASICLLHFTCSNCNTSKLNKPTRHAQRS